MSKIWGNFVGINFRVPLHSGHCYFQKAVIFKGCYLREAATFQGRYFRGATTFGRPLLSRGATFRKAATTKGLLHSGGCYFPGDCYFWRAATFEGPLFLMFYSNR